MQSMIKTRALIIHEAERSAAGLASLLTEQGYEVTEKQWDAKQIQDYRQVFPSMVLFDMPTVDDSLFEACRSLYSPDNPLKPVIILLSALSTPDSAIQAFDTGVADIVRPPVDLRELVARIMVRLRPLHHYDELTKETIELGQVCS